ncbi:MAG: SufS family cysteine desulfurase [Chlorobi bacterium]|nr:SufS family cysteine desulfurase [Chlorobiota bacterium]
MFDVQKVREDFPILQQEIYGKPFVYFDNGATTQKPRVVLDTITRLYEIENSNIHRGVHHLSTVTTENYEEARKIIARYFHVENEKEIVYTHGTTDSINLVAFSFGEKFIHEGDEIILTEMEHHANIVPWQMLCERKKAHIKVWKMDDTGCLKLDDLVNLITEKTKLIGVTQVSNVLGTVNPVKEITQIAHKHEVPILIDGAQGAQHVPTDLSGIDCDFYAFSGHKIYGPTGIGVLYAKTKWLEEMPPYQGGGDMILSVTFDHTEYLEAPFKFEAGTTNYIGAIGLGAAIQYLRNIGLKEVFEYEDQLLAYATEKVKEIPGLRIYGEAPRKVSILSFLIDGINAYDTGLILDKLGVAVRTGHHCAQPVADHFGIAGTVRASFSFYNTFEEVDHFVAGLHRVVEMFQ